MYTQLLKKFDGVLAPPYPVMTYRGYSAVNDNITTIFSGLLQDPDEYLEVYLDEVWQPSDHGRS